MHRLPPPPKRLVPPSHLIDQAVPLFGRPLAVYAELDRRRAGAEVDAIRTSGAPPVDPMDAAGVLEIIEAARRSDETGRVVALNET
ncbi:MAG: hypothetical protein ACXVQS_10390 [Actinomycetota bacterium]